MPKVYSNTGALLAEVESKPDPGSGQKKSRGSKDSRIERNARGKVYTPTAQSGSTTRTIRMRSAGKSARKRKYSLSSLFLFVCVLALAIFLYVSNVLTVNYLFIEIGRIEQKQQRLILEKEYKEAQLARLTSLELIHPQATQSLGLRDTRQAPYALSIPKSATDR